MTNNGSSKWSPKCQVGTLALLLMTTCVFAQHESDEAHVRIPPLNATPTASPDGRFLLFVSDATGSSTVWIANRDGASPRPLVNWAGSHQRDPDWSSDGRHIAFASNANGGNFNIWVIDFSGGTGPQQLTNNAANNEQPRYSPDGVRLAFVSNRTGKRELWTMDANGANQRAVGLQSLIISDPAWNPSATALAYVGCTRPPNGGALKNGTCNLFTISIDASSARQLTFGHFQDWSPDWSTAGIVFSSSRSQEYRLWLLNPNTSGAQPQPLPHTGDGMDLTPRWDRSSSQILFARTTTASGVWATDVQGSERRLTNVVGYSNGGDVNTDGAITCNDLTMVRTAFGSRAGQTRYDLRADVNQDASVDARDLATVSKLLPTGTNCNQ